jgi:hypothetical protein
MLSLHLLGRLLSSVLGVINALSHLDIGSAGNLSHLRMEREGQGEE